MFKQHQLVSCLFSLLLLSFSFFAFSKPIEFVEWKSPIPRFADLNLEINEVANIAGDGLFLLVLNEEEINLWSKGKIKTYNARITLAAAVINSPLADVKAKALDIASMPEFMPQISNASILAQPDETKFMAEWLQTYELPFLKLKANFVIQHTLEETGDVSGLLLEGDIDAGAFRWEFIEISKDKTLVVYSYWGDQKSAGLAFKIFMNAQPEFELSMGAITSSMVLTQLKAEMDKGSNGPETMQNSLLPKVPSIPSIKGGYLPYQTVNKLSQKGRLILVSPKLWIQGESKPVPLRFVSAISIVPETPEKLIPFATDYPGMAEYLRYYKKAPVEKLEDKEFVDGKIKINIGPVFVGINAKFFTRWNKTGDVQTYWAEEDSDLYPFTGAMEFLPLSKGEETLMVYTMALDIGDEAGWLLKMGKKLHEYAMMISLHQVITLLDKQGEILNKQVKEAQ